MDIPRNFQVNQEKTMKNKVFISILLAIVIKVVGYYFAEVILYGNWVAPFGSIPGNIIQVGVAGIIVLAFIQQLRKYVKAL